jgi:hypothetical protein
VAKLTTNEIKELAKKLIVQTPGGIRYAELVRQIQGSAVETPVNTINGSIWNLDSQFPSEISKPSRGLFSAIKPDEFKTNSTPSTNGKTKSERSAEVDYYSSFAEWLKADLDEVVVATDLGGAGLQKKWGTPDVVGVYKPTASNLIKFPLEVVSAEIKIDPTQSVVAFGQAVAYRLFSAKSYIVMPTTTGEEDLSRLESLCLVHGIGLVIFTPNPANPDYTIRVRAQRFPPDMFYVNEFADTLKRYNLEKFELLFS